MVGQETGHHRKGNIRLGETGHREATLRALFFFRLVLLFDFPPRLFLIGMMGLFAIRALSRNPELTLCSNHPTRYLARHLLLPMTPVTSSNAPN